MASNIILIGMMGSGKSTIARAIGKAYSMKVIDSDREIEAQIGKRITEVFESSGESVFRSLESKWCESLEKIRNTVIATGGGIILDPENQALLRQQGFVVWLNPTLSSITQRTSSKNRPLLKSGNPEKVFLDLFKKREPIYKSTAHMVLDTSNITPLMITKLIYQAYRSARR